MIGSLIINSEIKITVYYKGSLSQCKAADAYNIIYKILQGG